MKLEIEVCDHCRRKPKAGLRTITAKLHEKVSDLEPHDILSKTAVLCLSCRDRVWRFVDRGFTKKNG